ncbi:MAG: hypothetical protein ABFS16_01440 [Bacteroidota bacterium]
MKIFKSISLVLAGILISQFANAQFSLTGEFRPRTEVSHGYKTLAVEDQDASTITAQRSRLNFIFNTENIKTKLVLQDVRRWGSQKQLVTNEDYATSIHEAWAEVLFTPEFSLKAGRQELIYDDHRIFGSVGWAHQARSHDVAIFKYEGNVKLHFGIAHHENGNLTNNIYDGPDAYKDLQYVWFNNKWETSSLSLLFLNNGIPKIEGDEQVTKFSQTIGGRFSASLKPVTLASNIYFQTGEHISGKDISAINFLIEASVKQGLTLGLEHISGTAYNESEKMKSFTPFYGTNHKFNGFMDYFYVGNHIGNVGLNDIYLKYKYTKNKFGVKADLHYFGAAAEIAADTDKYLGTELDLSVSWAVKPMANISAGWSMMFAGDSMEILKGGDSSAGQHWAYVMLSVTPAFIK